MVLDHSHHVLSSADGAAWQTAAYGLGERDQVRCDAEPLRRPTWGDRGSRLHLVEDQERSVSMRHVLDGGEITRVGQHDADVHHHRLDNDRSNLVAMAVEGLLERR